MECLNTTGAHIELGTPGDWEISTSIRGCYTQLALCFRRNSQYITQRLPTWLPESISLNRTIAYIASSCRICNSTRKPECCPCTSVFWRSCLAETVLPVCLSSIPTGPLPLLIPEIIAFSRAGRTPRGDQVGSSHARGMCMHALAITPQLQRLGQSCCRLPVAKLHTSVK